MPVKKTRSDKGVPRKPALDIPEQALEWFARQPLIRREKLLRELQLANKCLVIREELGPQPAVTLLDGQTESESIR